MMLRTVLLPITIIPSIYHCSTAPTATVSIVVVRAVVVVVTTIRGPWIPIRAANQLALFTVLSVVVLQLWRVSAVVSLSSSAGRHRGIVGMFLQEVLVVQVVLDHVAFSSVDSFPFSVSAIVVV